MKPQFENRLMSSFLLWLDNKILTTGQGFVNNGSLFYNVTSLYNGYYTYANPYGQFVSDFSVPNANVITGVYLNNTFVSKGQSGLVDINYDKGEVYFSNPITVNISGNYAVKDFNIRLTNEPEEILIFETKYSLKPKIAKTLSGVPPDIIQYPVIFIKNDGGNNEPFAFGGLDDTITTITTVIIADSLFNLEAVLGIMKDSAREYIPLINQEEMPFNVLGGYGLSGNYNYTGLINNKIPNGQSSFINDVSVFKFTQRSATQQLTLQNLNPNAYFAIANFEIHTQRYPRK